jgi:pSer/pThr/pTyr-binding forkhead associated (FHA) protein
MRVILTVVEGPHAGRAFAFDQHDTFYVGRSIKAQFSLPKEDRYFSRMHFLVEVNPPLVRVMDLGSRNGTYVNGARVQSVDLRHGDRIKAGRSVLEVTIGEKEGADHLLPTQPAGTAEELAARFEEEWLSGRGPRIEDFLNAMTEPARSPLLRELVLVDMELRLQAGDQVRVEDYLKRFTELKADQKWLADFVVAECTFRRGREPGMNVEEFSRRFPTLSEQIAGRLIPSLPEDATLLPPDGRPDKNGLPRIAGYQLDAEIGRGGMGVVYRARDAEGRPLAIKVISPAVAAGGSAIQRFLREADILRRLNHRHIVGFRALGEVDGALWFAMDLVAGADAAKIVEREGPMDPGRAVRLMLPILGALTYAHAGGFVHRDIKPANLLVTQTAEGEEARLADFGLARSYEASRLSGLTVAGALGGTPLYMAPEQVLSLRDVKPPADQYSAAATLYFLLTGKPPYDPGTNTQLQFLRILEKDPVPIRDRRAELPEALAVTIHRALAREPAGRYADVAGFATALRPFESSRV